MSEPSSVTKEDYSLREDDWIAECLSLSPERAIRFPRLYSSWDALAALYLVSHLESQFWITDELHVMIAEKAYRGCYQGDWQVVQEILEHYPKSPEEYFTIFTSYKSPEEFFGNLAPRARRMILCIGSYARDPHGRVRRHQRHRGYRDKGTLRPSHRPVVIPPHDEQVDRRKKIGHPLIRDGDNE